MSDRNNLDELYGFTPEQIAQAERLNRPSPKVVSTPLTDAYRGATHADGERALANARKMVREAGEGHKRNTLFRAAYLLGGYVEGRLLDYDQAFQALKDAIDARDCDDY